MKTTKSLPFPLLFQRFKRFMFSFNGRSTRKEFWIFFIPLAIIEILSAGAVFDTLVTPSHPKYLIGIPFLILYIFSTVTVYALFTRRLHDIGRSGYWILVLFILNHTFNKAAAIINLSYLLFLLYWASKPSALDNKYGSQWEETK